MAVYRGSVRFNIDQIRVSDGHVTSTTQSVSFDSSSVSSQDNYYVNSNYDYIFRSVTLQNLTKDGSIMPQGLDVPIIIAINGGWSGGVLLPVGVVAGSQSFVSGGAISLFTTPVYKEIKVFDSGALPEDISDNGLYYEISSGDWLTVADNTVIATASQVENLPSGVDFNGWLVDGEVIKGNDGKYYDTDGNEMFSNLPSGVIPTHLVIPESATTGAIYAADDGKFYDEDGFECLENLPSGVEPVSCPFSDVYLGDDGSYYDYNGTQIFENLPSGVTLTGNPVNDIYAGSDGNYYNDSGIQVLENLPSGVTITGEDGNGNYTGSDGKTYDINGDEVIGCNGTLIQFNNKIRLTIVGVDVLGNDVNIGGDITIGQSSVNLDTLAGVKFLRSIKHISARNMTDNVSVGNGQLKIRGFVLGAKMGVDEMPPYVDPDVAMGNFNIATCVFNVCKKYADIVVNDDMPLGFASQQIAEIGYYVLNEDISLVWEGFDDSIFPYCCPSLDNHEIQSGGIGKEKVGQGDIDLDLTCVCDGLENIAAKIESLMCICDKLEGISDKLDSIRVAIEEKELSVEIEPCSPVVTNPVNNITVQPCSPVVTNPVNNISVQPCSPVVTNPVNNITVTPSTAQITVEPCEPVINNVINEGDVNVDNSDLIDKLDELFTTTVVEGGEVVKKDITDIIKDKQCENVVECIVEPVNMAYEGYGKYVDKDMLNENLEHL